MCRYSGGNGSPCYGRGWVKSSWKLHACWRPTDPLHPLFSLSLCFTQLVPPLGGTLKIDAENRRQRPLNPSRCKIFRNTLYVGDYTTAWNRRRVRVVIFDCIPPDFPLRLLFPSLFSSFSSFWFFSFELSHRQMKILSCFSEIRGQTGRCVIRCGWRVQFCN